VNGGISQASNHALQNACGEFVLFLDHDDELHPFALLELIRCMNQHPDCQVVYSDEDMLDRYGRRCRPAFKPDFDEDRLLSSNYICHLTAFRRDLLLALGGLRPACDGAQDWDLLVRVMELGCPETIRHIPKPLYHWRMHEESTAMSLGAKPYVQKAWEKVLTGHVDRTHGIATVEPGVLPGFMRVKRKLAETTTIAAFVRTEDGEFQVAIVRTASDYRRTSIYEVNACAVRLADDRTGSPLLTLSQIKAHVFVFINRPLETLNHCFFEELATQALRPECGLVAGISSDCDRRALHTGFIYTPSGNLVDPFVRIDSSHPSYLGQLHAVRTVETISDEFFAVRRELLAPVGGLSGVASDQMPRLAYKLVEQAHRRCLRVLVTPYAIATFHRTVPRSNVKSDRDFARGGIAQNLNLADFEDPARVAKGIL
jgi:hypothetical protein